MKIIITRHGETEENKIGVLQGHLPGTLSDLGKEQAERLAERLKDEKIDLIISSDLARAFDTAKTIAKFHEGADLVLDKNLRELFFGKFDGKPVENLGIPSDTISWVFVDDSIENSKDIFSRANVITKNIVEGSDKTILLVGHCVICNAVIGNLLNKTIGEFEEMKYLDNASVSVFEKEDGELKLKLLNCMEHLK